MSERAIHAQQKEFLKSKLEKLRNWLGASMCFVVPVQLSLLAILKWTA